jgi:hypothetical protein
VSVRIAGDGRDLGGLARPIVCEMGAQAMDGYEGVIEAADCERVSGWAKDATHPDESIRVDIYADGALLQSVAADADGHGFAVRTPEVLKDGRPHTISVRVSARNVSLRNSPKTVTCAPRGSLDDRPELVKTESPISDATRSPASAKHERASSFTDNGDGTITDLNSGLMWEKKIKMDEDVDAANPHDADNCYPWGGKCAQSGADCRVDDDCGADGLCQAGDCQAEAPNGLTIFKWVDRLNAIRFAGYDDWGIPNSEELYSIVNPLEEGDPAANAAFKGKACGAACGDLGDPACACAQTGLYWAAPATGPRPDESWMMFFYCTDNLFLDLHANRFYVRAVRRPPRDPSKEAAEPAHHPRATARGHLTRPGGSFAR